VAEARLAVHEAENALEVAENRLHVIELMHPLQKAQHEMAVNERKLGLMRAKNDRQRTVLERQGELTLTRERYVRLHERLEYLQKWVNDCKLYAPRAGLVVHGDPDQRRRRVDRPPLAPGERVGNGMALLEVVDPHRFAIAMTAAPQIAKRIEPGNEAVIRVDALPEERFEGRVTEVRPSAGRGDGSVVTVQLEDAQGRLRVGMSAQVEIAP
jgi:multidrug resistance efflux pump